MLQQKNNFNDDSNITTDSAEQNQEPHHQQHRQMKIITVITSSTLYNFLKVLLLFIFVVHAHVCMFTSCISVWVWICRCMFFPRTFLSLFHGLFVWTQVFTTSLIFDVFEYVCSARYIYIYTNSVYKIYIMNVSELASNRIVSRFEFMFAIHTANPKKCWVFD